MSGTTIYLQNRLNIRAAEVFATIKEPAPEAVRVVRQRLVGEADEDTLLQMLGLAPYQSFKRNSKPNRDLKHEYQLRKQRPVKTHGVNGYKAGCRCSTCKSGMVGHRLLYKPPIKQHGTETAYKNGGCRCEPCCQAASVAAKRRREAKCQPATSV